MVSECSSSPELSRAIIPPIIPSHTPKAACLLANLTKLLRFFTHDVNNQFISVRRAILRFLYSLPIASTDTLKTGSTNAGPTPPSMHLPVGTCTNINYHVTFNAVDWNLSAWFKAYLSLTRLECVHNGFLNHIALFQQGSRAPSKKLRRKRSISKQ